MKVCSVVFCYAGDKKYDTLSRVFEHSVRKNCPAAELEMVRIKAPRVVSKRCFASNTVKLDEWLRVMSESRGDVVFMDCDMIVLKDLSPAFLADFDIGFTVRTHEPRTIPYNGGVVFARHTEAAKHFVELWKQVNDKMYADRNFHEKWRAKYAGINQAAFGYVLEKVAHGAKLRKFQCREWNACREDWMYVGPATRVVHVKSELRRLVIDGVDIRRCERKFQTAVQVWRDLHEESRAPRLSAKLVALAQGDQYDAHIEAARETFKEPVIARKAAIAFLCKSLRRMFRPTFGICHGSGRGDEQQWFAQQLRCEVVGTEIAPEAEKLSKTLTWDFNKPNPGWKHCADFVYSNAFALALDQRAAMLAWLEALKPGGVLIIEGQFAPELVREVPEWTGGAWEVSRSFGLGDSSCAYAMISRRRQRTGAGLMEAQ